MTISDKEILSTLTLDFVKASISDGKPDKQAVVQWIQAEREKNPDVSYAELAEMLMCFL